MKIISIHDGHNAGAAYLSDGQILFGIQEERLTNEKNIGGFPRLAIQEILSRHNLDIKDVDIFLFVGASTGYNMISRQAIMKKYHQLMSIKRIQDYDVLTWRKIIKKILPKKYLDKLQAQKLQDEQTMRLRALVTLGGDKNKVKFIDHHTCHAAAAAYGWNKNARCAVVTADGSGDNISGTVSIFDGEKLERKAAIAIHDSVARIYSLITFYMGMVPNEHEYKLMGMAPYAQSTKTARELADYWHSLFEYSDDGLTYHRKPGVESIIQFGPRIKEALAFKRFDYVAAGIQIFIEEFISGWIKIILKTLDVDRVALGGGLFMNVKLNQKIMELDEVKDIFIYPSCGDDSNVFGALYQYWFETTGQKIKEPLTSYCWGGDFDNQQVTEAIKNYKFQNCQISYQKLDNIEQKVASLLANNQVVARFKGRMEFGARALGNRSILANPSNPDSVKIINKMIKNRDFWMPFAPSLIDLNKYVDNPKNIKAPYMILTFDTRLEKIPFLVGAVQPYDGTCRPQEVIEAWNPSYYNLIKEFEKITTESVILNTSFNLHGYPLVYKPEDALYVFDHSGLEYLAIENYLITKNT